MGKIILLFAILSASSGCTVLNTYRFRVQDAADGQSIAGVQAEGNNDHYVPGSYGWPMLIHTKHHFAVSDPQGLVRFSGGSQQAVTFTKEGYEPCTVVASSKGYKETNKFFNKRTFSWEEDEKTALIELQPLKAKKEEPREEEAEGKSSKSESQADN
jgi:hypothetical protein